MKSLEDVLEGTDETPQETPTEEAQAAPVEETTPEPPVADATEPTDTPTVEAPAETTPSMSEGENTPPVPETETPPGTMPYGSYKSEKDKRQAAEGVVEQKNAQIGELMAQLNRVTGLLQPPAQAEAIPAIPTDPTEAYEALMADPAGFVQLAMQQHAASAPRVPVNDPRMDASEQLMFRNHPTDAKQAVDAFSALAATDPMLVLEMQAQADPGEYVYQKGKAQIDQQAALAGHGGDFNAMIEAAKAEAVAQHIAANPANPATPPDLPESLSNAVGATGGSGKSAIPPSGPVSLEQIVGA